MKIITIAATLIATAVIAAALVTGAAPAAAAKPAQPAVSKFYIEVATANPQIGQPINFNYKGKAVHETIQVICEQPQAPNNAYGIVYWQVQQDPNTTFVVAVDPDAPFVLDTTRPVVCSAEIIRDTRDGLISEARTVFSVAAAP